MSGRSYLYVPATAGDRLTRVSERGADAVIIDLEDAVVLPRKEQARVAAAEFIRAGDHSGQVWVRINSGDLGLLDIAAVTQAGLDGICLAKADTPDQLAAVDAALTSAEVAAGLAPGSIAVNPLIESALGLHHLDEIVAAPRVRMIQIGEGDLAADLGVQPGPDGREWLAVRTSVVVASRAAGIAAPIAAVSTNFRDLELLRDDTMHHRRLGFRGRACIHPAQLPIVHDVFTPHADEIERAQGVVAAYHAAVALGDGAMVDPDGRMLDEAMVRSARGVLALAGLEV